MSNHNEKYEKLADVIREHREQKGALMPVLQAAQNIFGCVPLDVQEIIADGLGVTLSEVYGVATFYSQFSLQPKGEYVCGVCLGTACYVKGSQKVLDKLCSELGVEVGQTTKDGRQATRAQATGRLHGEAAVLGGLPHLNPQLAAQLVQDLL